MLEKPGNHFLFAQHTGSHCTFKPRTFLIYIIDQKGDK